MIRVAVVGTGGIAGICHLPALRAEHRRAEVVAAVDVDADRVKAFCAEHDIPAAYTALEPMLENVRPDLVHICTPPAAHAAATVTCLAAGAWALCEKPPCLSLAEYDRILEAERDGGPYAAFVFQHRFGSGARRLRALIDGGALGRPLVAQCVTAWYRGHDYFETPWRGRWETEGGGPTLGHGIHQMDLMLSLLGDWTEVRAMAGRLERVIETEDVSTALVRFRSGAMATVLNSVLSPREESYLRFDFTGASVELRHLYGYGDADWVYTPAPHVTAGFPAFGAEVPSSHLAQLTDLLDHLERGDRPSGHGGRRPMELVTALYKSASTGLPVTPADLEPDDPLYHGLYWAPETS